MAKQRDLVALGRRAIDYYVDTGFCVFCEADDVAGIPHAEHCNVGDISCVVVDAPRQAEKTVQRAAVEELLGRCAR
jgi:hypothetical protein